MERTLIIIKPDAVQRGLIGTITNRIETKGLQMVGCKMTTFTKQLLEEHYAHLVDKPFFVDIVGFMTMAPVVLQVREGVESVEIMRQMIGVTNARKALPGTIRGDYAMSIGRNIVHASENTKEAAIEINRFFTNEELFTYSRSDINTIYESEER